MDSKKFQEIQTIIQKDMIQSTYKLALLRAIIEIAQESVREKVLSKGLSAYPFPLLQHKLLTYYYPLFAHASFVPQMFGEAEDPSAGRQLVLRTKISPIIQHYRDRGGYEAFLSDIERDEIPEEISTEYYLLLDAIRKTCVTQPMKFLGNSINIKPYSVVRYLAAVPQTDTAAPRSYSGYFAVPDEYTSVFEDPVCARDLLDAVIRRWVEYTLALSEGFTPEELHDLLASGSGSGVGNTKPPQYRDTGALLLASIFPGYESTADSRASPVSAITSLEKIIEAEYARFSMLHQSITDCESRVITTELKVQRLGEALQRIGALHGVRPEDGGPEGTFEALARYYAEQQAAHAAYADLTDRISRKKQEISELTGKRDQLRQTAQQAARAINSRKRQDALIQQLHEKIELIKGGSRIHPRQFGYVDKPVARFLMHCGDVAEAIVSECIRLIPYPGETGLTKPALPTWFIAEFDTWWAAKQEALKSARTGDSTKSSSRVPFLAFDERHSEIFLVLPSQTIAYKEGLDHALLVIRDHSRILHEKALPLYYREEDLETEEVTVRLERPAQQYHVELSASGPTVQWSIEGFNGQDASRLFDNETGRSIEHKRIPSKRFILLTQKRPAIAPETAVLSTGRLFGDWQDYHYYIIEPVDGLSINDAPGMSDGNDRGSTRLDVHIDPDCFDRNLRMDGRTVVPGCPPPLKISYADEETLSGTLLSIHPLDRDSLVQPIFRPLADMQEEAEIDRDGCICTVDLSHPSLIGKERAGAFLIRVRNEACKTDIRVECVFLPSISYRFSESLYLPAEEAMQVHLEITSPPSVHVEPEETLRTERTDTGWLITSNLVPRIQGKLRYPTSEASAFEGRLSISVPHAAWRFEDEMTGNIHPIQRSAPTIPDSDYLSLGRDLNLRILMPESYSGTGKLSMLPQNQVLERRIASGQGSFSLARFNDTFRAADTKTVEFRFAMEDPDGKSISFPLFTLQRWHVQLSGPPQVSQDESGCRIIEVAWEEHGISHKRFLLLWRESAGSSGASRVSAEEIPAAARTHTIREDREQLRLTPGRYYLQFYRMLDDWEQLPVSFPGSKANNVFSFFIAQEEKHASETDDSDPGFDRGAAIDRLISEIKTGDPERCMRAIEGLRSDYPVRLLPDYWPERYAELQKALAVVIANPALAPGIRSAAVAILGKNISESTESVLISVFWDPASEKELRIAIVKLLGRGTADASFNALLAALKDPDIAIRGEAADSLGRMNGTRAVKPLIEVLDDESPLVQRRAAAALGYTSSPLVLQPLVLIAFDETRDIDLRITSIAALGGFRLEQDIIQRLFRLSENEKEDAKIREMATGVLSRLGRLEPEAKRLLIEELIRRAKASSDKTKRISAIKQLSTFTDEEVISALMETALDESAEIRKASADSLGRIASPKAVPALVRLLNDSNRSVQEASDFACIRILNLLLSDINKAVDKRQAVARYLGEMGSFAVSRLLEKLRDAETSISNYANATEIRKTAVQALSRMEDPFAVRILCRALDDENDWIVWGAAQALGAIGDTNAVGPLTDASTRYKQASRNDTRVTFVYQEIQKALKKLTSNAPPDTA